MGACAKLALVSALALASGCGTKINTLKGLPSLVSSVDQPRMADLRLMSFGGYLNTSTGVLISDYFGAMTSYCLLVNDTAVSHCSWVTANHFPSSFDTGVANGPVVLTGWARNDSIGMISDPLSSPSVIIDTTPPVLASATAGVSSPTNSVTNWPMTFGAVSEAYSQYCIQENSTAIAGCSWVTGTLPATYTASAGAGSKTISYWVRDPAGNPSARVDSNTIVVDYTAPTLASVTIGGGTPTNAASAPLTYGAASAYASYCLLVNDTNFANCTFTAGTLPTTLTFGADGSKTVSVWTKSAAGNVSTRVDSNTVVVDTVAPALASAAVTNASPTSSTTYNLTYGAVTNGPYASYCILENSTTVGSCSWTGGTLPASFTVSATNNAKVLSVWIKDAAGNVSARVDTNSVTLDTTAPSTPTLALQTPASSPSTVTTPTFRCTGCDVGATLTLHTDSGCTSAAIGTVTVTATTMDVTVASALAEGSYTVYAKETDSAANASACSTPAVAYVVDLTAPALASATVTNASPTNSLVYNLTYGAVTNAPYASYCILENSTTVGSCAWTAGSLPSSYTVSATENAKVLSIWIKDAAGNVSTRVDTNSVTLQTTGPTLASATVTNSDPTNSTTYDLTYGAVGGTPTSYCILENSTTVGSCSWTAGALPASFTVSSTENAKVLSVWLKDAAGNVSTRVDTNSVTLDTTAPTLASATVTNGDPTNSTTYQLTYGAQAGSPASYCILENSTAVGSCSWTAGALPATFTVSATNNAKVLSIWTKDAAGNVSTRVDTNSVTLDTSALSLASASVTNASPTNTLVYDLTYGTVTGTYTKYCILENDTTQADCTFTAGALPSTFTVSATENAKVLSVWIMNAAGTVSARVDTNSVTLDTSSPTVASVTVTNTSPTNSTTYNLTYGAQTGSPASYCILENDTALANCTFTAGALPASFTVSGTNNAKVLSVWTKDAAGNVSTRADSNGVTLDTVTPSLASVTITNSDPTNDPNFALTYGAVTNGPYADYCILENSTTVASCSWTAGSLPASFTVLNASGAKTLSVWIRDAAGNVSTRVDSNTVTLDTSALALASVTVTNSDPTSSTTYNLTYGAVGTYDRYCILENDTTLANCTFTTGTLPATYAVSATNGAKVLSVWVKNAAGTVSSRVDANSVTLDTVAPALASATVTNASPTSSTTYDLTYGAVTNAPYAEYCILENSTTVGSCSWTAGTLPSTFTVSATENAKVLSIWIRDAAGNTSTRVDTNSVTLDSTGPSLASATVTNSDPTTSTTYNLTYGAVTNGPYADYCILENSTTVGSCSWTAGSLPATFAVANSDGAKVLSIWIRDAAGNTSTRVDTNSVTLDTTAPVLASATVTNSDPTNSTTYNLTYGAVTSGTYSEYCILENSTTLASCTFTAGTLPASFTVSATENAKVLSIWIRDGAGNTSTRVDTNSVTLLTTGPTLASATITNSDPTNSTTYNLTYGAIGGNPTDYCILENSTTMASCSWTTGALPATFTVSATENAKTLSIWLKDAAGNTSTRVDTNAVTLDTTAPTLASATVTNSDPTASTTYNLTYGAVTNGSYSKYCILENDTTLADCTFTASTLPATYAVTGGDGAKVLSIWIRDAAGNTSTRVDTNSLTLDTSVPALASVTITNSNPTNNPSFGLTYGTVTGTVASYCILENDTTVGNCSWTAGSLPASFSITKGDAAKTLSVWIKNAAGTVSARADSNSVTFDSAPPRLAKAFTAAQVPQSASLVGYWKMDETAAGTAPGGKDLTDSSTAGNHATRTGSASFGTSSPLGKSFTFDGSTFFEFTAPSAAASAFTVCAWVNQTGPAGWGTILGTTYLRDSFYTDTNGYLPLAQGTFGGYPHSSTIMPFNAWNYLCTVYDGSDLMVYANGAMTGSQAAGGAVTLGTTRIGSDGLSGQGSQDQMPGGQLDEVGFWSVGLSASEIAAVYDGGVATVTDSSPTNTTTYHLSFAATMNPYDAYCILENDTTVGDCSWTAGTLPATYTVSATNNAKVLSVWLKDTAGNVSDRYDTNSVTLDTSTPSLASATVTNSSPTNSLVYNLTYGTVTGTYADYCILENDTTVGNCAWTTGSLPSSYTVSATNDAKTLSIWLKTAAGNVSGRVDTNSVTLDTTAPVLGTLSTLSPQTIDIDFGVAKTPIAGVNILSDVTTTGAIANLVDSSGTGTGASLAITARFNATNAAGTTTPGGSVPFSSTLTGDSFFGNDVAWGGITAPIARFTIAGLAPYRLYTYTFFCSRMGASGEVRTTKYTVTGATSANATLDCAENSNNVVTIANIAPDSSGKVTFQLEKGAGNNNANGFYYLNAQRSYSYESTPSGVPASSTTVPLTFTGNSGTYTEYCILENDVNMADCVWVAGTLPADYALNATEGVKVLSVWTRDAAGNTSSRVDSNNVTLDTTAPTLASATVTNSTPTNSTTYSLTYGAQSGTYDRYCILENSTTVGNCTWTYGSLPSSFTVSTAQNAKVLSVWLKDSAGNTSTRVDTNSVTLDTTAPALASATVTNANPSRTTSYALSYGSQTGTYTQYCILENSTTVGNCSWTSALLPSSYTVTSTANAKVLSIWERDGAGNVSTRVDTNSVTYSPPVAFANHWPFTAGTDASYSFTSTLIDLTGGYARLKPTDQTDDDNTAAGFLASGSGGTAVHNGTTWDATSSFVRLDQSGTPTNRAELDASWTPKYSNLLGYWKLNGSGSIADGASVPATVGANGVAKNANGTGFSYGTAKLSQGMTFDGTDDYVDVTSNYTFTNDSFSVGTWVKATDSAAVWAFFVMADAAAYTDTYFYNHQIVCESADSTGAYIYLPSPETTFMDGNWHFFVCVRDKANQAYSIYVDGRLSKTVSDTRTGNFNSTASAKWGSSGGAFLTGSLDEVSIWNGALTANDIRMIYARQSAARSATFTSRVLDALATGMSWTTLGWKTTLPFGKELPDYSSGVQNETSTDYSSLVGSTGTVGDNDLMTGIAGLWHLDEPAGTTGTGVLADDSGNGSLGDATGTSPTTGVAGVFGNAVQLSGTGHLKFGAGLPALQPALLTVSAWFRLNDPASTSESAIVSSKESGGYSLFSTGSAADLTCAAYTLCAMVNISGTYRTVSYPISNISAGQWYLATMTYDGTTLRLYLNGQSVGTPYAAAGTVTYNATPTYFCIGSEANTSGCAAGSNFQGALDEVAVWSRGLSAAEVLQLYRRGVNRAKFQVRVCTAADCSDDATGANWKGPDGTNQTYFSELNNNTVALAQTGNVKKTAPSLTFSDFTSPVGTSRYFQYRTILESDDTGTSCNYGSGATWCSPEVKSVAVDPIHYAKSSPTIVTVNGVSALTLSAFVQTLGTSCAGGIGYNLGIGASAAAATWYWWDATANAGAGGWATADGTATKSSPATDLNSHASAFVGTAGTGTVYVKAFLKSDGATACSLDDVEIDGTQ